MGYRKLFGFTEEEYRENVGEQDQELIDDFLEQQTHLSKQTLKQYKSSLMIFLKWNHESNKGKGLTKLKPRDALRFQNYMLKAGLSTSAIKLKRSTVSSFYGYLEVFWSDEYPDVRNIYSKAVPSVGNVKKNEKIPLTVDEIQKISDELEKNGEWQKLAYLWFSLGSGARRAEVLQLRTEVAEYEYAKDKDGNKKNYYLTHNIRCKGRGEEGKVRKLFLNDQAMKYIKKWVEYRKENYDFDNSEFVFVHIDKQKQEVRQLSAGTFNLWCEKFSDIIDGKKIFPHLLRATASTNHILDGKDIKAVQQLLGHNSPETTQIYVLVDDDDDIDELF